MNVSRGVSWCALLITACGGGAGSPGASGKPSSPLVGAWHFEQHPEGLPCAVEIEFFDDGTAELNGFDDDSPEDMCRFTRLPFAVVEGAPAQLYFGPPGHAIFGCLYAFEGSALLLTCEDHARPPPDMSAAARLERHAVEEFHDIAAFAGTWLPGGALGNGDLMTISRDGSVGPPLGPGRFVIEDDRHVRLQTDREQERCLYRVTSQHLTLQCALPNHPLSESFGDFGNTVILVRQR